MAAAADKPKPEKPVAKPKSGEESDERKPNLDLAAISQLLSKEAPQARASTGRELTRTAALGAPTASAVKMSPSMWAALDSFMMDAYKRCWTYIGTNPDKYIPKVHIRFRPDGSLAAEPTLDNPAATAQTRILADSAMRAVRQCNPLRIPAQFQPYYEEWKARLVRFDNEEMF
jgi:colicin import membrane protein